MPNVIKRYYLAGPMRGIPEFNFPRFNIQASILRAFGDEVFNPAEREEERVIDQKAEGSETTIEDFAKIGFDFRAALACDMSYIALEATHIYMLEGWSNSKGATAERALALALGLAVEGAAA